VPPTGRELKSRSRAGPLRADAAWASILVVAIATTWCIAYGRTSRDAWRAPITYRGDALFLGAYLKAARDGHVWPAAPIEVPELNAPYTANWNDHPRTLRLVFAVAGQLSRVSGLFVALNGLLLGAHLLSGLSFFAVARYFRARREWAALGGLAFGLSHFLFWRSLDHLDLALGWHIPLCILVVTWAFSRRSLPVVGGRFAAALLITVVTALHNPYYSCLFAQFLLLGALAQRLRPGGRPLGPLLLALVLLVVFVADDAGSLAYQWVNGTNPGAARPYGNLERFALKPLELIIAPPDSGLAGWGRVARVYWDGRLYRGEGGSPYLGLLGGAALLWLTGLGLARALRRPPRPLPTAAVAILWIVGFSILGGGNQILGMLGFVWLRGTNRFSIWILAMALLYLVTRRLPRGRLGGTLVAALAVLVLADQVPWHGWGEPIARTKLAVAQDAHFVAEMEGGLPPQAMLFMLPLIEFPEGRPVLRAAEYEHLRPYIHSHRLRFSFGTDRGRPREQWQLRVAALPVPEMVATLEGCGFSGILLNRRGYPAAAAALLDELRGRGRYVVAAHPAGDYALVRLQPARIPTVADPVGSACDAPHAGTP
jgi:hypothetical protein